MTASAFSLSSLHPSSALEITAGEPVIGGLRGATRHYFCPSCMSWLFTRPEGWDDVVNIRSTLLENARSYRPFMETYTREKLAWATTDAPHSFDTFPPPDDFLALLTKFGQAA